MTPKHLLSFDGFSKEELFGFIQRGIEIKKSSATSDKKKYKTLGLLFQKPSTRTRVSFETAMNRLGGNTIFLSSSELQISRGEPIADTAKVLSSMIDILVVRNDSHDDLLLFAENSTIPIINGLTNMFHPCQILADLMTFFEENHQKELKKVCWIGDGNNVCNSYIQASKIFNFEISIFCPKGCEPNKKLLNIAKENVVLSSSKEQALEGANIVTTDVWTSMDSEQDTNTRKKLFKDFYVDEESMSKADKGAIFLHCLPAHRGEEISFEMLDHSSSKVWSQAENRMHIQQSILESLIHD